MLSRKMLNTILNWDTNLFSHINDGRTVRALQNRGLVKFVKKEKKYFSYRITRNGWRLSTKLRSFSSRELEQLGY